MLQRAETAAHVGRRAFGNVGRRNDAGRTDADAAHDAPEDEVDKAEGRPRADGADGEQDRRDHHALHPAEAIGQRAGEEGADRRAEQGERDCQANAKAGGIELGLQGKNGTVDDGGVESEQKPTKRRSRGNEYDVSGVRGDDNPLRDD